MTLHNSIYTVLSPRAQAKFHIKIWDVMIINFFSEAFYKIKLIVKIENYWTK